MKQPDRLSCQGDELMNDGNLGMPASFAVLPLSRNQLWHSSQELTSLHTSICHECLAVRLVEAEQV
jgi:hypothetical protein